ncbi:MAG TPA: PAS domain S-box protein [Longimicrobiaceae bacterium]|jgi:PAS domain S-box-containing protein|nr:PAS domain S-box protein [Longimicrobiaceae bacterium]
MNSPAAPQSLPVSPAEIELLRDLAEATRAEMEQRASAREAERRALATMRVLHAVAVAANEAVDVDAALARALDEVRVFTGWAVGHAYAVSPADRELLLSTGLWSVGEPGAFPLLREVTARTPLRRGQGLAGRVLAAGEPVWIDDVESDAGFLRLAAGTLGVRAAFAFPVRVRNETVAVLEFFSELAAPPDPALLDVATQVGTQLGRVVERERAARALHASEARARRIVETAHDAFVGVGAGGEITEWSPRAHDVLGWTRNEAVGRSFVDTVVAPRLRDAQRAELARLLAAADEGEGGVRMEVAVLHRGGHELAAEASIAPLPEGGGTVLGIFLRDVSERRAMEEALRARGEQLAAAQALARTGSWEWEVDSDRVDGSDELFRVAGCERRPLALADVLLHIHPDDVGLVRASVEQARRSGEPFTLDHRLVRTGGEVRVVQTRGRVIGGPGPQRMMGTCHDVTERRRADEELRRSHEALREAQKMEAVGRLAGGVAHDFNNLLTAIKGYAEMLLMDLDEGSPLRADVHEIAHSAERAAALTRQLLTFSRRQVVQPRVVVLNEQVRHAEAMLLRLLGDEVTLVTELEPAAGSVLIDPGQADQVLVNLALNARDAMPGGGTVTVRTGMAVGPEADAATHGCRAPGPYCVLEVSDTGRGMDESTRARVFEPFFTTKARGEGTGMGLATVYGIVEQAGGCIHVRSEPGRGSTFRVYLPVADRDDADGEVDGGVPGPSRAAAPAASATILVAEDEAAVRSLVRRVLQREGYTVLEAADGREGLRVAREHAGPIDLVVTDVIMPVMSGRELADQLAVARPGVPVLFMSGYTDNVIASRGDLEPGVAFLAKPFGPDELAARVRDILRSTAPSE